MDLKEAFGGKFIPKTPIPRMPEPPRAKELPKVSHVPVDLPVVPLKKSKPRLGTNLTKKIVNPRPSSVPFALGAHLGSVMNDPAIYLIQLQMNRTDCHLICLFFIIFTITLLMTSQKR